MFPQDIAVVLLVVSKQRLPPVMKGLLGPVNWILRIGGGYFSQVVHRPLALIPQEVENPDGPVGFDGAGGIVEGQSPAHAVGGDPGIREIIP